MWAPTPNFRPLFGTHAQQQRIQRWCGTVKVL
jgi:hypothetical protein